MKQIGLIAAVVVCATLVLPCLAAAQTAPAIPPSITTPDKVESSIGTLQYKDGGKFVARRGQPFMSYQTAQAKLRKLIADSIAGGGTIPQSFTEVFDR